MATQKNGFDAKWLIPVGILLASIGFGIAAIVFSHSGSTIPGPNGGVIQSDINVSITTLWHFWASLICLAAAIVIYFAMRAER